MGSMRHEIRKKVKLGVYREKHFGCPGHLNRVVNTCDLVVEMLRRQNRVKKRRLVSFYMYIHRNIYCFMAGKGLVVGSNDIFMVFAYFLQ